MTSTNSASIEFRRVFMIVTVRSDIRMFADYIRDFEIDSISKTLTLGREHTAHDVTRYDYNIIVRRTWFVTGSLTEERR